MRITKIKSNADAKRLLVGRKIVAVELDQIPEDNGEISGGRPTITLDNGLVLAFDVDDYGSGTYGVNLWLQGSR